MTDATITTASEAGDTVTSRRVDKGIRLFAEHGKTLMDVNRHVDERLGGIFDLAHTDECILAAVYGDFAAGCDALGIGGDEAYMYGFDARTPSAFVSLELEWVLRLAGAKVTASRS